MALPLLIFKISDTNEIVSGSGRPWLQLASCFVGCIGFALWFHVKYSKVIACAVGAFLTWGAYIIFGMVMGSRFTSAIAATVICALYAQIVARIMKAPATVFQTVSVFPLIPGSSLYYMMYGLVVRDNELAVSKGIELIVICTGIVLGMLIVEVIVRRVIIKEKIRQ